LVGRRRGGEEGSAAARYDAVVVRDSGGPSESQTGGRCEPLGGAAFTPAADWPQSHGGCGGQIEEALTTTADMVVGLAAT
jgi:hypothetical protein